MSSYAKALKQHQAAEKALAAALERLAAAREANDPARAVGARLAAQEAERAASESWQTVEQLRRLHWQKRASDAEQRLHMAALPLIAEVIQYRRWSSVPSLPPSPVEVVRHLIAQPLPPVVASKDDLPVDSLDSVILDRADDEI
tara:strand:- start:38572 stop:39003 length:432 start_codon:yes stop_codon:yes gene_type:complete